MAITLDAARDIARRHIAAFDVDVVLYDDPVVSSDYGWVFSYQSAAYLKSNRLADMLAGNAPLLVEGADGCLFELGTAHPTEHYIQMYHRFGDPHAVPGRRVQLLAWRPGARAIAAIKAVKACSGLGLKNAKVAVEDCLSGGTPTITCATVTCAEHLTAKLATVSFEERQLAA